MHVTSDSPLTDRAAVMLANSVMYADQDYPDPQTAPACFTLHDGTVWTPTADEWRQVCDTVTLITTEYETNTLVALVCRAAAGVGPDAALDDLVLVDHWHHATPLSRAAVVLRLAWLARTDPQVNRTPDEGDVLAPARVEMARSLQAAARDHQSTAGHMGAWFGDGEWWPLDWPEHEAAAQVCHFVDESDEDGATVASLHVSLLLAGGAR